MKLTEKELKILEMFCEDFAGRLGRQCCNDIACSVYKDWTLEEKRNLAKAISCSNGTPEEYSDDDAERIIGYDFSVFRHLSKKLIRQAREDLL